MTDAYGVFRQYIDGNWIDIGAVLVGLVLAWYRWARQNPRPKFVSVKVGLDIVNLLAVFPLFILAFAFLSRPLVLQLMEASRITLSIAGCVALFAVLEN